MPSVQVLPAIPTFGSRLADVLTQAGAEFGSAFKQRQQNAKVKSLYDIINDPKSSPIAKANAVGQLPKDQQVPTLYAAAIGPQAQAEADLNAYRDIFPNQFMPGMQPQSGGEPRNISPSNAPPIATNLPPGASSPVQGSPSNEPNAQGMGGGLDISSDEEAALREMLRFKGNKNPHLAGEAHKAESKLNQLEQMRREKAKSEEAQRRENSAEIKAKSKENRTEIKEYSKPYEDITKLQSNFNKLKEAQNLIENNRVSVDENWVRGAVAGILEGEDSPLAEFAKTADQQKLWYLLKDALKPKEIGGSNPSTKEVLLSRSALPSIYNKKEANAYIIQNLLDEAEATLFKADKIKNLRAEKPDESAGNFKKSIEDEASKFLEEKLEKSKKKFAPKISQAVAFDYIKRANGDRELAEKMAREEGYEF
jgi:hypothetical protein